MSSQIKKGWDGYAKNPTLYVKNVPEALPKSMLEALFGSEPGFTQVRIVRHMRTMVFVDFDEMRDARSAMDKYQGFCFEGTEVAYPDDFHLARGIDIDWDKDDRNKRNNAFEDGPQEPVVPALAFQPRKEVEEAGAEQLDESIRRLRDFEKSVRGSATKGHIHSAGGEEEDSTFALIQSLRDKMEQEAGEEVPMGHDDLMPQSRQADSKANNLTSVKKTGQGDDKGTPTPKTTIVVKKRRLLRAAGKGERKGERKKKKKEGRKQQKEGGGTAATDTATAAVAVADSDRTPRTASIGLLVDYADSD
uniref:RRM domain-containing protein n=1 Tax=Octactis speculum TaxID=3111310 RepID=A0A7S2GI52_9STRA|mmetsp:Transcript_49081/g.66882  ORF Transcript_49081/g.66882 Transcript_49081/m.66882 type:complete len:305 (+) Transcript_49081:66-980(+)